MQLHPKALIVVDEDATAGMDCFLPTYNNHLFNSRVLELHVKTVKYFKSIERVQDEVEEMQAQLRREEAEIHGKG